MGRSGGGNGAIRRKIQKSHKKRAEQTATFGRWSGWGWGVVVFGLAAAIAGYLANLDDHDHAKKEEVGAAWTRHPEAKVCEIQQLNSYPHDTKAFTQGLVIENGALYESTGLYKQSELREVDLFSGRVLRSVSLDDDLFGEGLAFRSVEPQLDQDDELEGEGLKHAATTQPTTQPGRLYQLTWREGVVLSYNANDFTPLAKDQEVEQPHNNHDHNKPKHQTHTIQGEGWGLTSHPDTGNFILSNGTNILTYLDPETFKPTKHVHVKIREIGGSKMLPVGGINELEYIDSMIYANVYGSDKMIIIDPDSGVVRYILDLDRTLVDHHQKHSREAVLNGIAFDKEKRKMYITGKLWPAVYEVQMPDFSQCTYASAYTKWKKKSATTTTTTNNNEAVSSRSSSSAKNRNPSVKTDEL